MDELSTQSRVVIEAGRQQEGPPAGAKGRVRQVVAMSIAGTVAVSAGIGKAAAPAGWAAWKACGLGLVVVAGMSAGVVAVLRTNGPAKVAVVVAEVSASADEAMPELKAWWLHSSPPRPGRANPQR